MREGIAEKIDIPVRAEYLTHLCKLYGIKEAQQSENRIFGNEIVKQERHAAECAGYAVYHKIILCADTDQAEYACEKKIREHLHSEEKQKVLPYRNRQITGIIAHDRLNGTG